MKDETQPPDGADQPGLNTQPEDTQIEETPPQPTEPDTAPGSVSKFGRLKQKLITAKTYYLSHKKITIPLSVVLVIGLLLAVPASRYPILGLGLKKNFTATVLDSKTNKPVSSVDVTLAGKTVKTDQAGVATFERIKVGPHQLTATKKYYKDSQTKAFVPITGSGGSGQLKMDATGRQVKVMVTNKLDGSAVKEAVVSAADTEAKTDDKGEATIVLPADKDSLDVTISGQGFNKASSKIMVTEAEAVADQNKFAITPTGKIYFLSKRTGQINVMKSDLDGSNAQVVLAATGNEEDGGTILLASQDWKYLALKSRRAENSTASLFLIDTSNGDKLTTMDEGAANFTMVGWSGHSFVYQVDRTKTEYWQPNKYTIKSFDADSAKITALDSNTGEGTDAYNYLVEYIGIVILIDDTVYYTKSYNSSYLYPGSVVDKQDAIYSVNVNGQNKKLLKGFPAGSGTYIDGKLYEPKEIYYRVYRNNANEYYEVGAGVVTQKGDLAATFDQLYPTFLGSPSKEKVFWSESRDGKNTLFIGDSNGQNETTISELSEYNAYGWFTDKYLLLSKNSSELYIAGSSKFGGANIPVKITDYHKPNTTFYGYGGGYGGL